MTADRRFTFTHVVRASPLKKTCSPLFCLTQAASGCFNPLDIKCMHENHQQSAHTDKTVNIDIRREDDDTERLERQKRRFFWGMLITIPKVRTLWKALKPDSLPVQLVKSVSKLRLKQKISTAFTLLRPTQTALFTAFSATSTLLVTHHPSTPALPMLVIFQVLFTFTFNLKNKLPV